MNCGKKAGVGGLVRAFVVFNSDAFAHTISFQWMELYKLK
jgi:hypothetical protein